MYMYNSCFYLFFFSRDLAIDMRMKLGDWFKVIQLLEVGGSIGKYIVYENLTIFFLHFVSNPSHFKVCSVSSFLCLYHDLSLSISQSLPPSMSPPSLLTPPSLLLPPRRPLSLNLPDSFSSWSSSSQVMTLLWEERGMQSETTLQTDKNGTTSILYFMTFRFIILYFSCMYTTYTCTVLHVASLFEQHMSWNFCFKWFLVVWCSLTVHIS